MKSYAVAAAPLAIVFLAGGTLRAQQTTLAFSDSGRDQIQAVARDALGYLYVAGTTNSPDFPVRNAAQPQIGSSQLMRSADRGVTWTKLTGPPPTAGTPQIAPHPALPQMLFATSSNVYGTTYNSAISKSTDGGVTWRAVETVSSSRPTGATGLTFSEANPATIFADLSTGLSFSSDSGETWTTSACPFLACGSTGDQVIADPLNPGGIAASFAAGQGPYISSDGGHTFTSIRPNICCGGAVVLYDPFHRNGIYVAYNLGTEGNLFYSTDNGSTWVTKSAPNTPPPSPGSFSGIQTLVADPDMPNVIYAITLASQGLFQSADAGTTWTALGSPNYAVRMIAMPRACGPGGGLLDTSGFSPDFGKTWQALPFAEVSDVATGPSCLLYAARNATTDAFVAKLSPDGRQILWATFLGGNENDIASALAVAAQGGVYVGGMTSSTDFPGATKTVGAFAVKLDSSGRIVYSTVFNADSVSGIAVDSQGNAWLAGLAAAGFPVTPGALDTQYDSVNGDGYLAKLSPAGNLVFGTYLGAGRLPVALAVDNGGQPIIAGPGSFFGSAGSGLVLRLTADGSQIAGTMNIAGAGTGPPSLAFDAAGDIFVLGNTAASNFVTTPGAYVSPTRSATCTYPGGRFTELPPGDIFVMKLSAASLTLVYSALLAGPCGSEPGNLFVDSAGRVTFSLSSGTTFPLKNPPIDQSPSCALPLSLTPTTGNGVISQLSADGSALLFSTYTSACGVPVIAPGDGSSAFAGLNFANTADPRARMVQFPLRNQSPAAAEPRR